LPSQDPPEILFERRQKVLVSQWSARVLVGTQEFDVFLSDHPGEKGSPVGGQLEQRTDLDKRVVPSARARRRCSTDTELVRR
jgi:hypothetical protein